MEIKTGDLVKHRTNDFFYMVVTDKTVWQTHPKSDFKAEYTIACTWLDQEGHVQHTSFFDFELSTSTLRPSWDLLAVKAAVPDQSASIYAAV